MFETVMKILLGSMQPGVVSRSSIIIPSVLLLGMGLGQSADADSASFCGLIGFWGLTAYVSLSFVAYAHKQELNARQQESVISRLYQRRDGDCGWIMGKPALDKAVGNSG